MELTSLEKEKLRKNEYQRRVKREREAAGLCTVCGKRKPLPGIKMCPDCQAKKRAAGAKYKTPEYRRKYCEKTKMRYAERIAQGLCGVCGLRPFREGKHTCPECAEKLRIRARGDYQKRVAENNNDPRKMVERPGRCAYCHSETVIYLDKSYNRWMCAECYVKRCQAIDSIRGHERMQPRFKWLKEVAAATV